MTKTVHLEIVSCIIFKSFTLFLGNSFNMHIVNNRRFYAINKNKVSIILLYLQRNDKQEREKDFKVFFNREINHCQTIRQIKLHNRQIGVHPSEAKI